MITVTRPGHYKTRNISFFKEISPQEQNLETDQEEDEGLDALDDNKGLFI